MLTKQEVIQNIIVAYHEGAFLHITGKVPNAIIAKSKINFIGPVNKAYHHHSGATFFTYSNEMERLQFNQFVEGHVELITDTDIETKKEKFVTPDRKIRIEELITKAYQEKAQFIIGFPVVSDKQAAYDNVKNFGTPILKQIEQGKSVFIVDDIQAQIEVKSIIEEEKEREFGIMQQYIDAVKSIDKSHYISLATLLVVLNNMHYVIHPSTLFSLNNIITLFLSALMVLYFPYINYWITTSKWYNKIFINVSLKEHIKLIWSRTRAREIIKQKSGSNNSSIFATAEKLFLFSIMYILVQFVARVVVLGIGLFLTPLLFLVVVPILGKRGGVEKLQMKSKEIISPNVDILKD